MKEDTVPASPQKPPHPFRGGRAASELAPELPSRANAREVGLWSARMERILQVMACHAGWTLRQPTQAGGREIHSYRCQTS